MAMELFEKSVRRESRLAVFEHVVKKEKDSKSKKFVANRLESDESSPSDSELIIDDERDEQTNKKKLLVRFTEEPLSLICDWNSCGGFFNCWQKFNSHLIDHAKNESDSLHCFWKYCTIVCDSLPLLVQHISYHGYLTKLKNIGLNVLERNDLPACRQTESYTFPVSPDGYTCEWQLCSVKIDTVYSFYSHVEQHVRGNPRIAKGDSLIICYWNGCHSKFGTRYKLGEHVRTHTKERTISCPTCCTLFSNKTKFCDHRRRQLSTDLQSYQCSQCLKLFPTERLLRDHMRSHINHYKCTMCDMTCSKPSILAKHIRFKHVKDKPFKCMECDKKFVTKHNLLTHLETHKEDAMQCDTCDFKCRTKVGLQNHYVKKHEQHPVVYECHCCKKHFRRGGYLTKHLMKVHNYHWPSGHTRFRYRKDKDGIYRLQTVRYESLEVTEEMIKSETMQSKNSVSLEHDNESPPNYVVSVADDDKDRKLTEEQKNDVLITINDLDEHGNIVKSQVMESKEIIGTVSDDNLVLSEHRFSDNLKDEAIFEEDDLKIEMNELTDDSQLKVPLSEMTLSEDYLSTELKEFVDISKIKAPLSKNSNRKGKPKTEFKKLENVSEIKDPLSIAPKKRINKRNNNRSKSARNMPKKKVVLIKHIRARTGQLQTKKAEIKIQKVRLKQSGTLIQSRNTKSKKKRSEIFSDAKCRTTKMDSSFTSVKYTLRRSQRLRNVRESAKHM